jgi:hypothetical protein
VTSTELFRVTDPWGDEIVLTQADWDRIVSKRPDVQPYRDEVRRTLEAPNVVYEGRWPDTKVFYAKDLMNAPFRGCYVAAAVRYNVQPATIRTVYFPLNIQARLGNLLYADR